MWARRKFAFMLGAMAMAAALACGDTLAQTPGSTHAYPSRPIRIIVPQSPGASTDITARLIAQRLSEAFRQTVVVDNRPGAGTIIGTELAARATPDGHTVLVVASGITVNPGLYKKIPYDVERDLAPVTQLATFPNLLAAHPSFAAKTLNEVIALAKAKPGTINYASAGTGTGTHMSAALLMQMTGIDIVHIPYNGGGPAAIATIGGQTQLIIGTTIGLLPHVRSGKLKAIAVTSAKRSAAAPDVPTFAESGAPGYEHAPWVGMFVQARTPQSVIQKLHVETVRILDLPEVKKIFASDGAEPVGNTPAAFAAVVKSEIAKWTKVVRAAGIKVE